MNRDAKIYVAGHRGLVGGGLVRALQAQGHQNIVTRTSAELDLRDGQATAEFFAAERPDYVIVAAAKVGGIHANNTYPAQFIYDNLAIAANTVHQAYRHDVKKLLFLGSSCIYPKFAPQPMPEDCLLTGVLEPTNEPYAIAKIAGIKLCESYRRQYGCNFISAMPTNLYGPGDNFDLENSHVLPALLRKAHEAVQAGKSVLPVWGSGRVKREFLHVDDLSSACLFLMDHYDGLETVNVGTGVDLSIRELAETIVEVVGGGLTLEFDASKPDGTPRKLLDVSRLADLGWRSSIDLRAGIESTYRWYLSQ
ncbi:MAG: GDP-L-fucose synthase [Myxococcota bacterium]|nr:GDP-L-fucose synthase [Myxococcota bacterium]